MRTLAKPCRALLVAAAILLHLAAPRATAQQSSVPGDEMQAAAVMPATHLQKLLADDATVRDRFGKSVALSADGGTALVGAYLDSNGGGAGAGSAYVFVRSGGVWTQQQKLLASDPADRDWFGYSVALSADGNTALIGAIEGGSTFNNSPGGKAYVFTRSGGVWTQQQKLQASDKAPLDDFGWSVALSADGNTALISALNDDHTDMFLHGSAYVFTRSGGVWTERQKLLGTHPTNTHVFFFGQSVALSGDGNAALVGADNTSFFYTRGAAVWTLTSQLQAADRVSDDFFGMSVALNSDGTSAVIGAPSDDNSLSQNAGSAYFFARVNGAWTQQRFQSPDEAGSGAFGASVSLSSGGTTAVVGAPFGDAGGIENTGVAHVFIKTGSIWTRDRIQSPAPRSSDRFGEAVAVSADGGTALVGAKGPDFSFSGDPNNVTGEAHLFGVTVPPNPIDETAFFVRQHYLDFLNREPDDEGFAHWKNVIDSCGTDPQCREVTRINVSGAFFLSIEFQETGYLVERIYKVAYADAAGTSTLGGTPHQVAVPVVRFEEFLPDTQRIGQGVVVNKGAWQEQLEVNKVAFTQEFVQRTRFVGNFPLSLTPAQYVDRLNGRAGGPLNATERQALIDELTANNTTAGRASVLRKMAEHPKVDAVERNRAFVLMQYFGYLRRNPNSGPDTDYTGYEFWLGNLDRFNGNFVQAELVKAFISSAEYRQRFGQ